MNKPNPFVVNQTVRGALYVRDASKPFVMSQPVRGEPVEPHPSTMLPSTMLPSTMLRTNGINKVRGDLYVRGEPTRSC